MQAMIEYWREETSVQSTEHAEEARSTEMIELLSRDFKPLEEFTYSWRWMDPKRVLLPEAVLAQIRPLREEKAKDVYQNEIVYERELSVYAFDKTSEPITSSSLFEWIRHIDYTSEEIGSVQGYLATFEPQGDQLVIVSWELTTAVALPWHIFCSYFWDFCYCVSDDVCVWPLSEQWHLLYYHEDQLIFGRPRLPLLDQAARERAWNPPAKPLVHRDEVLRLLRANEKIAAIKLYHHETGVGYKRALDAVNKLLAEREKGET
jgi:hypothetical protein